VIGCVQARREETGKGGRKRERVSKLLKYRGRRNNVVLCLPQVLSRRSREKELGICTRFFHNEIEVLMILALSRPLLRWLTVLCCRCVQVEETTRVSCPAELSPEQSTPRDAAAEIVAPSTTTRVACPAECRGAAAEIVAPGEKETKSYAVIGETSADDILLVVGL
jgi:hypothetical protein